MTDIKEIRSKYPQYNDLSDQQLADGLHAKYYSDMPVNDFYSKIGFSSEKTDDPSYSDVIKSAFMSGLKSNAEKIKAIPSTIAGAPEYQEPEQTEEDKKYNKPFEFGTPDLKKIAYKTTRGITESSPEIAGSVAGAAAGVAAVS